MPGSVSLSLDEELLEGPLPGLGDPVPVRVENTGTTMLTSVRLGIEGSGADHIELSADKKSWNGAGEELALPNMKVGKSLVVYARASYLPSDNEDGEKLHFVLSAISVG